MTGPEITVDGVAVPNVGTIVPANIVVAHHIAALVVLIGYGGLFMWYMIYTTLIFVHLPLASQTPIFTAWVGGTQTMMAGLAGLIFKFYTDARYGDRH
ncbi:MAG TPA: hypothetical protein VIJ38_04485 [Acidobacteriaceae bacterium]